MRKGPVQEVCFWRPLLLVKVSSTDFQAISGLDKNCIHPLGHRDGSVGKGA